MGHDWGAIVAWQTVLLNPTRFTALINMSVPYRGRSAQSPMERMTQSAGDNFHYIVYHNEPGGVAEAEYDANPRGLISHVYLGIAANSETLPPKVTDPLRSAGGWIDRLGAPIRLPDWLTENDLNYIVSQFEKAGVSRWCKLLSKLSPQLGDHRAPQRQKDQHTHSIYCRRRRFCDWWRH